jgi:hypothetical protein
MPFLRTAQSWTAGLTLLPFCLTGAAVLTALVSPRPAHAQENIVKAPKSSLTGITLNNALRLTGGAERAEFQTHLDTLAKGAGGKRGTDETLLWVAPTYTGLSDAGPMMNAIAEQMQAAGYQYKAQDVNTAEGAGAVITALKGNETLIGLWLKTEKLLALTWCRLEKADASKPAAPTAPGDTTTVALPPDNSAVLVPGNPPLTQQMVDHTCHFLAYLLEAPFTDEQKATLEKILKSDWKNKPKEAADFVDQMLQTRAQVFQKNDAERDLIRKQIQPKILAGLKADKKDAQAQWILGIYNAAHTPLASGNPPLTRQMTDAYTELFYFMASEVIGQKYSVTPAAKNAMAKMLATGYTKSSAESKQSLAKMPLLWSAVRVAWPHLSAAEKKQYRDKWTKDLQVLLPKPKTTVAAAKTTSSSSKPTAYKSSGSKSSSQSLSQRMAAMQAMQNSYQMQNQMMWQSHYSRMNMAANLGNSPYRYVNAYGNPY